MGLVERMVRCADLARPFLENGCKTEWPVNHIHVPTPTRKVLVEVCYKVLRVSVVGRNFDQDSRGDASVC